MVLWLVQLAVVNIDMGGACIDVQVACKRSRQVIKVRIAYYIFWHYLTYNSIILLACAIIFVCYHFRDTLKH